MTTPIDDMLQNLIEKLHAARFQDCAPTVADLHQVAVALEDTRRASATSKTDYRAILGAVADLSDRVKKLESPSMGDVVNGMADDMRKLSAMRDVPVTADRIATSTGEDLDEVADALGLSRKGWPYQIDETDDALRVRCAAALFGQTITRELADTLTREAKRAREGKGADWGTGSGWHAVDWVIDAVMAAAGAHPDGRPIDRENDLAVAMERSLTMALSLAPESISWPRALELVRQAVEAVTALGSLRRRIDILEERNGTQAKTIHELQVINARGITTVVDQAAQITALRAEVKRLVELDGVKMTDAEVAALTGAT